MSRKRKKNAHKPKVRAKGPSSQNPTRLEPPAAWTTNEKWGLTGLLLMIFSTYVWSLWPTLGGGDSGELTAAACDFGVVHPPGYPLFVLLGHIFSWLPFGTPGWRVNLLSAVTSTGAAFFFFLALRRLTRSFSGAFLATGLLAFSPLIWRYSVVAEVFPLNNLFVCLLFYLFIRHEQQPHHRLVYLMGFLFGLGLSNHHTLLFVGVPMGLWILFHQRQHWLRPKPFLSLTLISLLGLSPYLLSVWSSSQVPIISWGNLTNWDGFFKHFLRQEYGTFQLASQGEEGSQLFAGLGYYLLSLSHHAIYVGGTLIAYAGFHLFKNKKQPGRSLLLFLALIPLVYLVFFHSLANLPFSNGAALYKDIVSRFWLMPHILAFLFIACGWAFLQPQVDKIHPKLGMALIVIFVATQWGLNFTKENQHDNDIYAKFGQRLLDPVEKDAVFLTLGDINTNTVRYLQVCEGHRTDVKVLDRSMMSYPWLKRIVRKHYPDVTLPGVAYHPRARGGYDFKKLFDANYGKHPIYLTFVKTSDSLEAHDHAWKKSYHTIPYGLSFRVHRSSEPVDIDQYISESKDYLIDIEQEFPKEPPADSWDHVIWDNYWLAHHLRAAEILQYAMKNDFNEQYLKTAADLLEDLIARHPRPHASYYKNLGISYHHLARVGASPKRAEMQKKMKEAWKVYLDRSPASQSPTYKNIQKIVGEGG